MTYYKHGGYLDKKDNKDSILTAVEGYPMPDVLSIKRPHKNKITNEIRYFNEYDWYYEQMKTVIFYGYENALDKQDWELLEDNDSLRILYGPSKKEKKS